MHIRCTTSWTLSARTQSNIHAPLRFLSQSTTTRHRNLSSKPRSPKKPYLTLDHFLQRQRVLALYREITRAINALPDTTDTSTSRAELRLYARTQFERNRDVTDLTQIRYLVSTARTEFESIRGYVERWKG